MTLGGIDISLTERQKAIVDIAKEEGPITGEQLAEHLHVTRAALRADLAVLVMSGLLDSRSKVGYFYTGKNLLSLFTEELNSMLVRDIQSVPVVLTKNAMAYDAVVTMFVEDVGSVFIVEGQGRLIGVVSRKDLLKASLGPGDDLAKIPVQMVMTPLTKLIVTEPGESVVMAARKIIDNEIDALPVVKVSAGIERSYEIVGRLTKTNLARLIVDLSEGKRGYSS
ncbi:helix-turn-helix transcriptional regulator [Pectinatus frisingensis]|jgi:CBS domain-containing protein|uniref:helix-turn-helix transcriptional regulator n=1 Tax=Pectinatus frisingensis TaxID=865 RepID=UPI0015F63DFB|nr:helix-turn-helix transcriptional regulator [Pectinatus frisingensis]